NYQDTFQVLPPGMDRQHVGCLVYLLPFLGQEPLFNNFSLTGKRADGRPFDFYYEDPVNRPPCGSLDVPRPPDHYGCEGIVKVLLCPSAPSPQHTVTALLTVNYDFDSRNENERDYNINGRSKTSANPPEPVHGHVFSTSPGRRI